GAALPRAFAVPGGWGDVVVATLALALLIVGGALDRRPRLVGAWNALGLLDILFVVATAARLALADSDSMNALLRLPLSLLVTFLVPIIIADHLGVFWRVGTPAQVSRFRGGRTQNRVDATRHVLASRGRSVSSGQGVPRSSGLRRQGRGARLRRRRGSRRRAARDRRAEARLQPGVAAPGRRSAHDDRSRLSRRPPPPPAPARVRASTRRPPAPS